MLAFLSYVREDFAQVLSLKQGLEENGIACFMDTESIAPGDAWEERICGAINRCDFFVPCFSEHYSRKSSTWMNRELELALKRQRVERDRIGLILPVLLSGGIPELPRGVDALRMLNWISLTPDSWCSNLGRLLTVMRPDRPARGAGLDQVARRFSEGRPNDRIDALRKIATLLDLPEALALVERGLGDPQKAVRMEAVSLITQAGEPGAAVAARVIRSPNTSWDSRLSLVGSMTMMRGKAAPAVPAIVESIDILLSKPDASMVPPQVGSQWMAAMFITCLGEIGEPASLIRDTLTRIRSPARQIREAIESTLSNLEA
jgi:hypothetical protein